MYLIIFVDYILFLYTPDSYFCLYDQRRDVVRDPNGYTFLRRPSPYIRPRNNSTYLPGITLLTSPENFLVTVGLIQDHL